MLLFSCAVSSAQAPASVPPNDWAHTVKLNNGVAMPLISLGTWQYSPAVAESTVREVDDGGVEVEEGSASAGVVKSAASPGAAASLAAGAAEERRVLEAERGVGDRAKVRLMQKRSEARARRSEAEAGKR